MSIAQKLSAWARGPTEKFLKNAYHAKRLIFKKNYVAAVQ